MAPWGRAHVVKAALLAGVILLVLFNFYNFRFDSKVKFEAPTSMSVVHMRSSQWPKRTRTSSEQMNFSRMLNASSLAIKSNHTEANTSAITTHNTTHLTPPNFNTPANYNRSHTTSNTTTEITSGQTILVSSNITSALPPDQLNTSSDDSTAPYQNAPIDVHNHESFGNFKEHFELHQQRNLAAEETDSTKHFLKKLMTTFGLNMCPAAPPNLNGPIEIDTDYEKLTDVESRLTKSLLPGGWYKPKECNAKDRVAIVIPYRDRSTHLPVFLKNIHPFLMKQQIDYGIFILEQIADGLFNRAALMNVGFVEALKLNEWDCFIFHDIDLIPMDDRNLYTCPDQPRHMSVAVDTMGFKLPYSSIFGGVSAMTVKQFRTVNGFSNSFWGWGGEDDDMSNRLKHVGYHIARYPVNIARYTMLSHRKEKANPKRYEKLVNGVKKFDTEGLNSLKYKVHLFEKKPLYTWILVEIKQDTGS